MSERLLSRKKTAERLGISVRSFERHKASLIAKGLQLVTAGRRVLYREASIDRIIKNAAEKENSLYEVPSAE